MTNILRKTVYSIFVSFFSFVIPLVISPGIMCNVFGGEFLFVERERLEAIVDNTPLARSEDKPAWDYLFGILRENSETEIEKANGDIVGFTELNRQPAEYRGKLVRITGRLVRCEWIPQHQESEPFDEKLPEHGKPLEKLLEKSPEKLLEKSLKKLPKKEWNGFYESWILVRDKKDIPISVCSLTIPEKISVGDGLNEHVSVTGFFYKRRLFLSSDNEELTTPTILAKTLHWTPLATEKPKPVSTMKLIRNNTFILLGFLLFLWFSFRIFSRHLRRSNRKSIQIKFSDLPPKN
ncbi:MAG: hypothetical protein LBP87_07205 [Planctomycetaceae bacterium]|jgi:hypothetical protein|nr:hypothetical protein [Planctomycetaceae bacterium]